MALFERETLLQIWGAEIAETPHSKRCFKHGRSVEGKGTYFFEHIKEFPSKFFKKVFLPIAGMVKGIVESFSLLRETLQGFGWKSGSTAGFSKRLAENSAVLVNFCPSNPHFTNNLSEKSIIVAETQPFKVFFRNFARIMSPNRNDTATGRGAFSFNPFVNT